VDEEQHLGIPVSAEPRPRPINAARTRPENGLGKQAGGEGDRQTIPRPRSRRFATVLESPILQAYMSTPVFPRSPSSATIRLFC
jgi:hypothetical protein